LTGFGVGIGVGVGAAFTDSASVCWESDDNCSAVALRAPENDLSSAQPQRANETQKMKEN
jgi:hypothetical protein